MATMTKKNEVSDGECPDGTCPLKQTSGSAIGGHRIAPSKGCRTCGGGPKRRLEGAARTLDLNGMGGRSKTLTPTSGNKLAQPLPSANVVPAMPEQKTSPVSVPDGGKIDRMGKGGPLDTSGGPAPIGKPDTADASGGGTIVHQSPRLGGGVADAIGGMGGRGKIDRMGKGGTLDTASGGSSKPNLASVAAPPAPFVLAPIVPLPAQQPRPDYCDATGMNELIACQRRDDGTFPTVSSACAQSFRDLIARGLSVAEIISGNELCSDEFRRLLAGATPALIEPPKQGAPVAAAKGMPLAVAAPTMIVAPGGAPAAVNPVQCMALFLTLPSSAQAAIVGSYGCPMAQSLAPEIARGSRTAAADFVQWFGSAFRPESDEVSRFCAAVLNARGVAAAGAPSLKVGASQAPVFDGATLRILPPGGEGPITIFGMPAYGRVFVDGREVGGEWIGPQAWQVRAPVGQRRVTVVAPDGLSLRAFTVNVSENGAAVVNYANGTTTWVVPHFAPGGAPGGILVEGRAYVPPAGAAKGGMGLAIQPAQFSAPRDKGQGYYGVPDADRATLGRDRFVEAPGVLVRNAPTHSTVYIDGSRFGASFGASVYRAASGENLIQITAASLPGWRVVRIVAPNGETRESNVYIEGTSATLIDWNALAPNTISITNEQRRGDYAPVKPLTSPGSTGTAVYNAKAAGAPGGKSMVLQGPNARRPTYDVATPTSQTIGEGVVQNVNTSPSSVAPGTAAVGAPSTAQCIAALRAIASRDPRAIVAAFHQSGLDGIVPSRPGSGNTAADVLALIDDCAARRQQYPRQFDSFCRIAQALSPSKPGGYVTRPAGDPPPDRTFSVAEQQQAQWLQGLQGGGLGPATQGTAVGQGDVAYRPPADPGITTTQILSGLGSVATTGIGVLNTYLDRESRQHIAELAANASSANAQIAAQAQRDIAQIQADAQVRIAALGPNPSPSAVAGALNTATNPSTATQPPAQGMSTGTVAAIGVGAVAVAGIAYLALSKKGR